MNIFTLLLGCTIHITLILLLEGVVLFGILYPILKYLANSITEKYSNVIFANMLSKGYDKLVVIEKGQKPHLDEPLNTFIKACAIDERKYLKIQDYMPYIIYGILLFVLLVCGIIIIIIVKYLNFNIDYKFVIITSVISFILISVYAFMVMYFVLAKQPYVLNIESSIYHAFLDIYNSI